MQDFACILHLYVGLLTPVGLVLHWRDIDGLSARCILSLWTRPQKEEKPRITDTGYVPIDHQLPQVSDAAAGPEEELGRKERRRTRTCATWQVHAEGACVTRATFLQGDLIPGFSIFGDVANAISEQGAASIPPLHV